MKTTPEQMSNQLDYLQEERDSLLEFSPTFDDDFQAITDEIRELEQESRVAAGIDEFEAACGIDEDDLDDWRLFV